MLEAEVESQLCDGCQDCLEQCRYDAIDMIRALPSKRLKAWVDPDRCCGCHACAPYCPRHGIFMRKLPSARNGYE